MANSVKAKALYDFTAESEVELSFAENDELEIVDKSVGGGWWTAKNKHGDRGLIPEAYVEIIADTVIASPPISAMASTSLNESVRESSVGFDPYTKSWDTVETPRAASDTPVLPSRPRSDKSNDAQIRRSDSDFDDDDIAGDTYSTISEVRDSFKSQTTKAGLRTRLFDNKGIENFLLNGPRQSVREHDMCVVTRSLDGRYEWETRDNSTIRYRITATSEQSKLAGLKQFTVYCITPEESGVSKIRSVYRRFKQFDWLHAILTERYRLACIPGLPEKFVTGRFEPDVIEARKYQLELWINRVASHPLLKYSPAVVQFLTKDLNYNSGLSIKEWKKYKRDMENDPLLGTNSFGCIHSTVPVSLAEADQKVDSFHMFLTQFEKSNLSMLNQVVKFSDFSLVSGREMMKFAQGITDLAKTFHTDCYRYDCKNLSNSITAAGMTFGKIARQMSDPACNQSFLYSLREYSTMVNSFSTMFNIQRSMRDTLSNMKVSEQHKIPIDVLKRAGNINAACLAEISNFDNSRKVDYRKLFKDFVSTQKTIFQEIVKELSTLEERFSS